MKKSLFRRIAALVMSALTLWAAIITVGSHSVPEAVDAIKSSNGLSQYILRWELGDFWGTDRLTAVTVLALCQSPHLLAQRSAITSLLAQSDTPAPPLLPPDTPLLPPDVPAPPAPVLPMVIWEPMPWKTMVAV